MIWYHQLKWVSDMVWPIAHACKSQFIKVTKLNEAINILFVENATNEETIVFSRCVILIVRYGMLI